MSKKSSFIEKLFSSKTEPIITWKVVVILLGLFILISASATYIYFWDEADTRHRLILVAGIFCSLFVFGLTSSVFYTHSKALRKATQLTRELKEIEGRYKDLSDQLEAILDHIPGTIFYKDKHNNFVHVNKYLAQTLGKEKEELKGLSLYDLYPKDIADEYYQDDLAVITSGVARMNIEESIKTTEGTKWFDTSKIPFDNAEGDIIGVIGISMDITERKNAGEALLNEQLLLRTLIDNIPDSIYCMDLDCRKTLANRTDVYYMGAKSEAEVLGKNDFDFYPKDLAETFFAVDQSVIQSGIPILNIEESLITSDGETKWLLSSKLPMRNKDARIEGLIGIGRDITDRKLAEEQVNLKNNELQKLNAEKDRFFSIIAHDLRSPFNGFLGLTEMMVDDLPGLSMEEIHGMAYSLRKSALNLFRLLENLLEWSKIQQGLIPFHPKLVQLATLIDESIDLTLDSVTLKEIEIIVDADPDQKVFADINMLQSIFRNIVSNAIKFTPRGGKIRISAESTSKHVEILVIDTGIGMSDSIVSSLFNLEINISRKGTEGEGSTGLGLIICKDFIEKHGGRLWVESETGKGSTFHFTIPFGTV